MIPVPEDQSDELVTVAGSTTEYTTEDAACLTSIIELNELFPYLQIQMFLSLLTRISMKQGMKLAHQFVL